LFGPQLIAPEPNAQPLFSEQLPESAPLPAGPVVLAPPGELDLRIRLEWGGGTPQLWQGVLSLEPGRLKFLEVLGVQGDEHRSIWLQDGTVRIQSASPAAFHACEVTVRGPTEGKLLLNLGSPGSAAQTFEFPLSQVLAQTQERTLDEHQNWLVLRRAPGDQLRVRIDRPHLIFAPGETLHCQVLPHVLGVKTGVEVEFQAELKGARGGASLARIGAQTLAAPADEAWSPWNISVPVPNEEGVYDLALSASTQKLKLGPIGRDIADLLSISEPRKRAVCEN